MTDIPWQFSIIDSNSTITKKRKQRPTHNYQRNLTTSSNATLPIITLSSFSNFEQRFTRMATNNKNTSTDFRMAHLKSQTRNFHRSNTSLIPKSSLTYPTISHRLNNQQENARYLYVVNTPKSSHRTISALNNSNLLPPQQPILSRPNTQYGHFLAYLRRQSLARLRRKQQVEEGYTDHVETTITLNLNKQSSTQSFQSPSHYSLTSLTTNTSLMPAIAIKAKQTERPPSSLRPLQRSLTPYRLNTFRQTPPPILKNSIDDQLLKPSTLLNTPRNSIVDDATMPSIINPYELHLHDDLLNYCYINDDNGIKYQGHMLSTSV